MSLKDKINKALDLKDIKNLKKLKFKHSQILIIMEAAGDYPYSTKYLRKLKLEIFR